jgi:16S rRNA processing protein RimM
VPEQTETEWVTIGTVVALFGIHGELKVRLLSDIPNRFAERSVVYLGPDHWRHVIKSVRPYKGNMNLLGLEHVNDTHTAEALCSLDICIPLAELAQLPPGSYYQHEIIDLQVYTLNGYDVGKIVDIIVTGSNDVYIVKTAGGKQVLIPAIRDVIKEIDLAHHTMYIDPMPGLLDNGGIQEREEEQPSTESTNGE